MPTTNADAWHGENARCGRGATAEAVSASVAQLILQLILQLMPRLVSRLVSQQPATERQCG